MDRLVRFEKTYKNVKAVDAHHYTYYLNNSNSKTVNYWLCSSKRCIKRIITRKSTGNLVCDSLPEHDHGNNLKKQKTLKLENQVVEQMAGNIANTPRSILTEVTNSFLAGSSSGLHGMQSAGAIKTKVWRARQKLNPMPKIPRNHQDIMEIQELPDKITKTKDGQSFLLAQCWTNDDQEKSMMVFLSDYGASILRDAPTWLMDGTFKSAPTPFTQVYLIMAKYPAKKGLVCAMALLPDKSSEVYELMFSVLKNKLGNVKVTQVVCDFEQAVLNTVKQVFPQVEITGCLFHSRKAIWTHICSPRVGLKSLFVDDEKFQEWVYMLYSLCYVPPEDLVQAYENVLLPIIFNKTQEGEDWEEGEEQFSALIEYLDRTWIGRKPITRQQNQPRRKPLFEIKLWNQVYHEDIYIYIYIYIYIFVFSLLS